MEIISPIQRRILGLFGQTVESDQFYLTGGTALAYFYLQHRRSNDLDFFTATEELVEPFSRHLESALKAQGMAVTRQRSFRSFVELIVGYSGEETLIQLAQDAPFRFQPVKTSPEFPGLKVDNLSDIASNKLLALFGRATLRDFIDIYILVQKGHFKPEALMQMAREKDPGFDLYWLGVALEKIHTLPDDSPDLLLLLEPVCLQELQQFFRVWREGIVRQLKY